MPVYDAKRIERTVYICHPCRTTDTPEIRKWAADLQAKYPIIVPMGTTIGGVKGTCTVCKVETNRAMERVEVGR